jgi:hypothetical protein
VKQQQSISNQPSFPSVAPIDPKPILQSESSTAIILAIAMLISILLASITGLIQVILATTAG